MAEPEEFYLTLSSNASAKYFPNNTVATFSNRLAEPVRLSDPTDWLVGLAEITMPPIMNHAQFSAEDLECYLRYEHYPKGKNDGELVARNTKIHLKPFYDSNYFVRMFRDVLAKSDLPVAGKNGIRVLGPYGNAIVLFELKPSCFVRFSEKVWRMLGLNDSYGKYGKNQLGAPFKAIQASGLVMSKTAYCRSVWVYSNCCSYRLVGDARVPLLRTIKLGLKENDTIHRVITHPYYFDVKLSNLHTLEITMRDNTGDPVRFFPGESVVTLHFKRKHVGHA